MSDHLTRHRASMEQMAYPLVTDFVARHPEYTILPDQSGNHSVTNYVIFGTRHTESTDEHVIFKVFCDDERLARERYALQHFGGTGLVPRILHQEGTRLLIQSYIPGGWTPRPGEIEFATFNAAYAGYSLGNATATLLGAPFSTSDAQFYEQSFYDGQTLADYFQTIITAAWQVQRTVPAYGDDLFSDSLREIEAALPNIMQQPRVLYHQDAMNMHFVGNDFSGFFDLEMCRVGTAAMQIGSLWNFFATYQNWRAFAEGYASFAGETLDQRDFDTARAFAHFLVWRYVTRSSRWQGKIEDAAHDDRVAHEAEEYARSLQLNYSVRNT